MKRLILTFLLLAIAGFGLSAQVMQVREFTQLPMDLTARTQPRVDLNGNPCAVIKIVSPGKNLQFKGNIIGEPVYKDGEVLIYIASNSRYLTIIDEISGTLRYEFPEHVEEQIVYELNLRFIENKKERLRTIASIGLNFLLLEGAESDFLSYDFMVGIVRKYGAYAKIRTNFVSMPYDGKVNTEDISSGFGRVARLSVTAGGIRRMSAATYIYAGVGYGYVDVFVEKATSNSSASLDKTVKVLKVKDFSASGLEVELGGIVRWSNLAISMGIQTNNFKYLEASLGMGFMF